VTGARRGATFDGIAPRPASQFKERTKMMKWIAGLVVVVFAVMMVPAAVSQMDSAQPVYTFVSQFQVPRANWAAYSEDSEKSIVPILEKLTADGSIASWSTFEHLVHTPDGYTHGAAWSSSTISGLTKVLDEVRKNGPRPGQIAATKHEDLLLQTRMFHAAGGTPVYARVICSSAKPDKPEAFSAMLKKLLVPTFEEQLKKGVASYWGVDEQYVNTGAPSTRCVVINYPNAEGMDKWAEAINATMAKWTPAERAEYVGASVADSRRDILLRVTHSGHK
jgi:hypothetical protein